MRTPQRQKSALQRGQVSALKSYPAPIGGWNDRDALAQMPPTDAVALENWVPRDTYCEIRGGYANWATGMTGNGKTLAVYNGLDGVSTMWATTASGVYNVTSSGAVGASVAARTNGKHQWINFGDGTNNYLIMVNGVDAPLYYNGTTWVAITGVSTPALSGVTLTDLIHVTVFKGRLFFVQKNSLSVWYLAAGAAGGALSEFDLSSVAKKGGYVMAMASWVVDAGDGPDDRAVFYTSQGEVIVYVGTNPASATDWLLVGIYEVGMPLGRRCLTKYGGDLVLISQNGTFPMAAALQSAAIDYKLALSFKIEKAFTTAARNYGSHFGWEATVYPAQSAMIVNIPITEDGEHEQYVMNTTTKGWCKFTDWNAEDFVVFQGQLYFTTSNKVVKAWYTNADGADNIEAYGKTAFSYFGSMQNKQFKMFRPVLAVNGPIDFLTDIDVDFRDDIISGSASYVTTSGALWDAADWDVGMWASGIEISQEWTSPAEYLGRAAAGKIKVVTNSLTIQWMSCDYMYEMGGAL